MFWWLMFWSLCKISPPSLPLHYNPAPKSSYLPYLLVDVLYPWVWLLACCKAKIACGGAAFPHLWLLKKHVFSKRTFGQYKLVISLDVDIWTESFCLTMGYCISSCPWKYLYEWKGKPWNTEGPAISKTLKWFFIYIFI